MVFQEKVKKKKEGGYKAGEKREGKKKEGGYKAGEKREGKKKEGKKGRRERERER